MCGFSCECSSACTVKTVAASCSEMSVTVYQIMCLLVSECLTFHQLYCQNLSSLTMGPLDFIIPYITTFFIVIPEEDLSTALNIQHTWKGTI